MGTFSFFLVLILAHLSTFATAFSWTCFDGYGAPETADCMQAAVDLMVQEQSCSGKTRIPKGSWEQPAKIVASGICEVYVYSVTKNANIDVPTSSLFFYLTTMFDTCPGKYAVMESSDADWNIGIRPHISSGRREEPSTNSSMSLESRQSSGQCKLPNTALTTMGLAQLRRLGQSGSSTPTSLPEQKIDKLAGYLATKIYDEGNEQTYMASAMLPDNRAFTVIMQDQGDQWDRLINIYPSRDKLSGRKLLRGDLMSAIRWLLDEGTESTFNDINRTGDFTFAPVFMATVIYTPSGSVPMDVDTAPDDSGDPSPGPILQCDPCQAITDAVEKSANVKLPWLKRSEVMDWEEEGLTSSAKFLSRGLEKRRRRPFNSGSIGSYGRSFGNNQPQITLSSGDDVFWWEAPLYPSTGRPTNQPSPPAGTVVYGGEDRPDDGDNGSGVETKEDHELPGAPQTPNIGTIDNPGGAPPGRYVDLSFLVGTYSRLTEICEYNVWGWEDPRAYHQDAPYMLVTNDRSNVEHYYDTEHVFELHMIKDFFYWMVKDERGVRMSPRQLKDAFTQVDPNVNSNLNVANAMMAQMPSYDTPGELFIVRSGLNLLKGAIMNGRPLDEDESQHNVLPRPKNFLNCLDILGRTRVVFQFLNKNSPGSAFKLARDRVHALLAQVDPQEKEQYAKLWLKWLDAWLTKREDDVQKWRLEVRDKCYAFAAGSDPQCWGQSEAFFRSTFDEKFPEDDFRFPDDWFPTVLSSNVPPRSQQLV
ncbi:hypothetical protein F5Y04DRAFT_182563 [Hypomontagnella monticulosa]|nr:hypothetical protein F5Y04DRAFT_182563 [Hypomontagnella monticulosa]